MERKELRIKEERRDFDVFLTVHHSIDLFYLPTLMQYPT
jgi:hypothetical protein